MSKYRGADPSPELVRAARVSDVPAGGMVCVEIDRRDVVLVNLDGRLYALECNCPHNGGPLGRGALDSCEGRLMCPWHCWTWDVRTGRAIMPPVSYRVATYEVRVDGDDILVSRVPR